MIDDADMLTAEALSLAVYVHFSVETRLIVFHISVAHNAPGVHCNSNLEVSRKGLNTSGVERLPGLDRIQDANQKATPK